MSLLKTLMDISEALDLDVLPDDSMKEIQKHIRDGAKDLTQLWANALELIQKAYDMAGVQPPTPDLTNAWKQYETNLAYSVNQLAKFRGMDDDWRMSSSMFRESTLSETFIISDLENTYKVQADNLESLIESISNATNYDVAVDINDHITTLTFSTYGIKDNYRITIQ